MVLRSWVVRLLSVFIVSARETNLFAHNFKALIKVKIGIVEQLQNTGPTFGVVIKHKVTVTART